MAALTIAQKNAHLDYYLDNLDSETILLDQLGKKLVSAAIEYIGRDNFFRVHKNLKIGSNYRSVPALRDKARLAKFLEENTFLVKTWFLNNTVHTSGVITEEVIRARIEDGTLQHCPYDLEDVKAVINGGFDATGENRGLRVPENAAEIKEWFDEFVLQRSIDLISHQAKLAILGVTKADHPRELIKAAVFNGDTSTPHYADLASDIMKAMMFLITDTFTNYLNNSSQKNPISDSEDTTPF